MPHFPYLFRRSDNKGGLVSHICFESREGSAEVRGPDRSNIAYMVAEWTRVVSRIDRPGDDPVKMSLEHPLRKLFRPDHHLAQVVGEEWFRGIGVHGSIEKSLLIDGVPMSLWSLGLNTGLRLGNDVVKLGVRLHAQCEMHTFVEGPNREWLAKIIEKGRATKLFRAQMGWEEVVELLRRSKETPVVTSFSVTEGFPEDDFVIEQEVWWPPKLDKPDRNGDRAWDNLGEAEQWRLGMAALRKFNEKCPIELKPDDWDDYYFETDFSAFDLFSED